MRGCEVTARQLREWIVAQKQGELFPRREIEKLPQLENRNVRRRRRTTDGIH